jgi:hypothetical protein
VQVPSWFTFLAAVVGTIGGLAGVASLVWQMVTWRRSTHRVTVVPSRAWFGYPDGTTSEELVCVSAHNTGSAAVTVVGWGIEMGRGGQDLNVTSPLVGSTPIPHRLESGSSMDVHVQAYHVIEATTDQRVPYAKMRPWVRLGTGEKVYSKKPVLQPTTAT